MKKAKSAIYWRKKADKLWSEIIREVGYCEVCGKQTGLVAHHLISKGGNMKFRHDISNGICLCRYHHTMGKDISAHGAMEAVDNFLKWLKDKRGGVWLWYIEHKNDKRFEKQDWEQHYSDLKTILEKT